MPRTHILLALGLIAVCASHVFADDPKEAKPAAAKADGKEKASVKDSKKTRAVAAENEKAASKEVEAKDGAKKKAPKKKIDPKEFPGFPVMDAIRRRKFDEAAEKLEVALKTDEDNPGLQAFRKTLSSSFLRQRKYDKAFVQTKETLEYYLRNLDQPKHQKELAGVSSLMRMCAMQSNKMGEATELIDRAYEAMDVKTTDDPAARVKTFSSMVTIKSNQLSLLRKPDEAREFVGKFLEEVDEIDHRKVKDLSDVDCVVAKSRLLYANAMISGAGAEERDLLTEFLTKAAEDHPDSIAVAKEYCRGQTAIIGRTYRNDPKKAQERIDLVREVIGDREKDDVMLRSTLRQLSSLESQIGSALLREEMIGKPAPELDVESWVNQGDVTLESLKGKVVMLDFWSVWCGPCIQTFPNLRDLHEQYGDDGLQIVGITRYYNYRWDDEKKRATRSREEVSSDDERAMLASFLEKHELKHPTIVSPKNSEMQKEFGVTGIPHVVLIDREGLVQLIKVGSGRATSEAIEDKIKELIKQ